MYCIKIPRFLFFKARKVEALKRNGTVSDCKVFGLYDSCMFQAASATNVASKVRPGGYGKVDQINRKQSVSF